MKTTPATPVGTPRRPNPASGWQRFRHGILTSMTALAALMLVFASSSCESPEPYTPIPADAFTSRPSSTLAAGDVIRVSYPGAPELNTTQKIMANGKVSLPTIGDVTAQGKSAASFQSQLTGLYQSHLQNPTVLVAVEEVAACVYVSGEVTKPGKVSLDRPMTAFEAIMEAGGFSKFANPKQVVVVRNKNGKSERYALNLADTLSGASSSSFYLRPYDTVYVKQSTW
jgi:polysaccharide export outer membrane protein